MRKRRLNGRPIGPTASFLQKLTNCLQQLTFLDRLGKDPLRAEAFCQCQVSVRTGSRSPRNSNVPAVGEILSKLDNGFPSVFFGHENGRASFTTGGDRGKQFPQGSAER